LLSNWNDSGCDPSEFKREAFHAGRVDRGDRPVPVAHVDALFVGLVTQVVRVASEVESLQQRKRPSIVEPELAVLGGHRQPVELSDVQGRLRMPEAADRVDHAEIVHHLDGVVAQRRDEQIAAPPVVSEVIDPPEDAGQHDPRSGDERSRCPVRASAMSGALPMLCAE